MPTLTPTVIRYVAERQRRGEITPLTARAVRHNLSSFAESFGDRPLEQLGGRAVERWIEEMHAARLAPSTQAGRLSSLRTFARWCVLNRIVPRDWTVAAPRIRRPRQVPRDLTVEHFGAILACCATPRERLIVWLMYGCGLRCVEVSRLDVEDYEPATRLLYVVGKGLHERHVPVPDPVRTALVAYLVEAGHGAGPLVRVADGSRRLGPERISGLAGRVIRDAGIKVRRYDGRSAHGLRAAAASDIYEACLDPHVVQEFLGHANLANVSVYLRRAGVEKVRAAQLARVFDRMGSVAPFAAVVALAV